MGWDVDDSLILPCGCCSGCVASHFWILSELILSDLIGFMFTVLCFESVRRFLHGTLEGWMDGWMDGWMGEWMD
jgi:hypothetical protein